MSGRKRARAGAGQGGQRGSRGSSRRERRRKERQEARRGATVPAASRDDAPGRATLHKRIPAMITPFVDAACVGGASIVAALVVLAFGIRTPSQVTFAMLLTGFAINVPHFLVSYRLLYGSVEHRLQYRGVSIHMPLILLFYMLFALAMYPANPVFLGALVGAGTVLLAWHYTGQAWGMMASFGFIAGRTFTPLERRLTRANLYVLLTWHVVWAVVVSRRMFEGAGASQWLLTGTMARSLYDFVTTAAVSSSLLGIAALVLQARRTGSRPPVRMVLPWIAIHLWYVLLYRDPAAIFWAQNAHALQYLIFPMRVEINRKNAEKPKEPGRSLYRHMVWYYAGTALLGILVMQIIPEGVQIGFSLLGHTEYAAPSPFQTGAIQLAVVAFINVHHYYIDNVIWKIRNPQVRRSLFGHLEKTLR